MSKNKEIVFSSDALGWLSSALFDLESEIIELAETFGKFHSEDDEKYFYEVDEDHMKLAFEQIVEGKCERKCSYNNGVIK